MKLAIIGGRDFDDYGLVKETIVNLFNNSNITEIVSGGASGADYLAELFAEDFNLPIEIFKADWNNLNVEPCKIKYNKFGKPYNALAGFNRNKLIVNYCDSVLAFWNGRSSGAKNSIDYAESIKKPVIVIKYA